MIINYKRANGRRKTIELKVVENEDGRPAITFLDGTLLTRNKILLNDFKIISATEEEKELMKRM